MAGSQKESDYVFEILPDQSVAFRRDDMGKAEALDALTTLLSFYLGIECTFRDIEGLLTQAPWDWRYVRIRVVRESKDIVLRIQQMDREPGKGSADNSVITHIKMQPQYTH